MADTLEEKLLKEAPIFDFHKNDMEAFTNMEYVTPFVYERELWVEKLVYGHLSSIMQLFIDHWHLTGYISLAYVIVIFGLKKYMSNRKRFEIQTPLFLWSLALAVFSIIGAIRTIGEAVWTGRNHDVYYSACNPSIFYGSTAFWSLAFVLSKVIELGDTVFIVLRKQPLIFLHWYHHFTVLVYSFYTYSQHSGPGRWFCVMNYVVHSFMYSYYALRAAKINVPKFVNIAITSMQIIQMTLGTGVCIYAYYLKYQGVFCHITYDNLHCGLLMYISYFLLFGNYFFHTYLKSKQPAVNRTRKTSESQNGVIVGNKSQNGGVTHRKVSSNGVHNGTLSSSETSQYSNGHAKKDD